MKVNSRFTAAMLATISAALALSATAAEPALPATMFHGDCNSACPIVLENRQQAIAALKPQAGALSGLMVSLDPLHDSPDFLAKPWQSHHLGNTIFRLAVSTNASHARAMAAAFNIKCRLLNDAEINHGTPISLQDADGRIVASGTQLSTAPDQEFLKKIRMALKSSTHCRVDADGRAFIKTTGNHGACQSHASLAPDPGAHYI